MNDGKLLVNFAPKINILCLQPVPNVCDQILREMLRDGDKWSLAHVIMNPGAESLLHRHDKMSEVYIITRGYGVLVSNKSSRLVCAGSVVMIPAGESHKLINYGGTSLEHLVIASPAFDPTDVHLIEDDRCEGNMYMGGMLFPGQSVVECFDGAKIIPYEFSEIDMSIAFGWVINDPARHKKPHYHKRTTEWIYIVEGSGAVEVNGESVPVSAGDFMKISPNLTHAIRNVNEQYMVALCICSPRFDMKDVYYRD